jgi:transcriptional regulator with XRE-family HTH domain
MEILKSIRDKFGLSQQDMATLLGMTREHYSMVEIGRRMLPAEPVQRFAALMPLYQQNFPLPDWPGQIPDTHLQACNIKLQDAKIALHKAEAALKACETQLLQQQALTPFINMLTNNPKFPSSPRFLRLLETLAYKKEMMEEKAGLGQWMLLTTQKKLCEDAVKAYQQLLPETKDILI